MNNRAENRKFCSGPDGSWQGFKYLYGSSRFIEGIKMNAGSTSLQQANALFDSMTDPDLVYFIGIILVYFHLF